LGSGWLSGPREIAYPYMFIDPLGEGLIIPVRPPTTRRNVNSGSQSFHDHSTTHERSIMQCPPGIIMQMGERSTLLRLGTTRYVGEVSMR
jgi:hypothetical protein